MLGLGGHYKGFESDGKPLNGLRRKVTISVLSGSLWRCAEALDTRVEVGMVTWTGCKQCSW